MSTQQPQAPTSNLAEALVASGLVKNIKIPQPERLTNSTVIVPEITNAPAPIISVPTYQSQNKNKRAQSNIDFSSVTSQRMPTQIKLSPIENIYIDRQANGPLPKLKLKPEGPSVRSDAPASDLSFLHDHTQKKDSSELTNEEILRSFPSNEPITFPRTMLLSTTIGKPQIASRANYENLNGLLQHLISQIELDPNSTEEEKIVAQRDAFNTVMSEIVRQGFYECSEKGDLFNNMRTYMNQTADQIPVLTNKLQKVREAAQNQIAALKSENVDLEKKNEALFAKYNSLEKDQNRLQSRLKFAEEKIPQLEENTRLLRLKNQETEIKASETLKKLEKVKLKKGKLKTLKIENQSIIEEMGKQIQESLNYKEKAQDTIYLLTDENDRLKKINIELKKEIASLREATNELSIKLEKALKESKKDSNRINEQTQTGFFSKQSNYINNSRNNNKNNNGGKNSNANQSVSNSSSYRSRNQQSYSNAVDSDSSDSESYYYYEDEEDTKEQSNSSKTTKRLNYSDTSKKESSNKTSVVSSPDGKLNHKNNINASDDDNNEITKSNHRSKSPSKSKNNNKTIKTPENPQKLKTHKSNTKLKNRNNSKSNKNDKNDDESSDEYNDNYDESDDDNEKIVDDTDDEAHNTNIQSKSQNQSKNKEKDSSKTKNLPQDKSSNGNDTDKTSNTTAPIQSPNQHKKRKKHKSKDKDKQTVTVEEIRKLKKDFDACQEFVGDLSLDKFKKLKETILERNGRFVPNNSNLMRAQDGSFELLNDDDGPPTEAYQDTLKMFVHNLMNRVMDKACYTVFFSAIGIQSTDLEFDDEIIIESGRAGIGANNIIAGGAQSGRVAGVLNNNLSRHPTSKIRIMLVDRETMCFAHELMRDEFKDNFTRLLDPAYSDRPPRSFDWIMKSIKSIYDEKTIKDAKDLKDSMNENNDKSYFRALSMPLFALQWSMRQYGLEYLAHQCCWDLVNTARAHQSKAAEIETFRKFLDEDYSTTQLTFFLRMRTVCMRRGITLPVNIFVDDNDEKDLNDNGESSNMVVYNQVFLTTSIAIEIIQKIFQKADQGIVDAAIKAVKHDVVRKPSPKADSSISYVSMITVLNHSIEAFQNYELNELRKLMLCCQIKPKMDSKSFKLLVKELIPSSNEQNAADLYRLLLTQPPIPDDSNNSVEKMTVSKKKFIEKFNSRSLLSKENTSEVFEVEKYYSTSPELEAVKDKWKSLLPLFDDALDDAQKREKDPSLSHEMLCLKLDIDNVNSCLTCFDVFGAHKSILTCLIQYQELLWTFKEPEIELMDETTNSIMNILKI